MSDRSLDTPKKTAKKNKTSPSNILIGPTVTQYQAFKADSSSQRRLALRPVDKVWERVVYSQLLRICEDGLGGKAITLVFTFMSVFIRGRNLRKIADAVDNHICIFIQQYNPSRWPAPEDDSAPYVESIEYFYPEPLKAIERETPPK